MRLFQTGDLGVRRLQESDMEVLAKWLSDPQVLQYYEGRDRPHDAAKVREVFLPKTGDTGTSGCLVEWAGDPIGYIQFYALDSESKAKYGYDPQESVYGMDQFIGETSCWGRGLGTRLVQGMTDYLREQIGADRIVMDPQAWNERAIHVYEKCGYQKVKRLPKQEWHEGEMRDCWLIEYRAPTYKPLSNE
ncbi:MAG TPA: GNAT family N-acetyltransferase [Bacilli bacterium]|nr:GNAT family N-acetyltransferase [Bacilli bacterium]